MCIRDSCLLVVIALASMFSTSAVWNNLIISWCHCINTHCCMGHLFWKVLSINIIFYSILRCLYWSLLSYFYTYVCLFMNFVYNWTEFFSLIFYFEVNCMYLLLYDSIIYICYNKIINRGYCSKLRKIQIRTQPLNFIRCHQIVTSIKYIATYRLAAFRNNVFTKF